MQPSYKRLNINGKFPNAERSYKQGLALPSSATLSLGQVEKISRLIRRFFGTK
jgi:dTDP-4-amino-4,6-dideoxygalactose transaminase